MSHLKWHGGTSLFLPTFYSYNNKNQLWKQSDPSGFLTLFTNNAFGALAGIGYSDGTTESTVYARDRLGRLASVTHESTTTTFAYNEAGSPLSQSYSGGPLDEWNINHTGAEWCSFEGGVGRSMTHDP